MRQVALNTHISGTFNIELENLRNSVLTMGGEVEQQLLDTLKALKLNHPGLAEKVVLNDLKINSMEIQIDEECIRIIAKRHPTASDLRLIMTISKAITDIERMGDEIERIAKLVTRNKLPSSDTIKSSMLLIGERVAAMMRGTFDAFARQDESAALAVYKQDNRIDSEYKRLLTYTTTEMEKTTEDMQDWLDVLWAMRSLERIGDRCKNVCEYVVYLTRGTDVRHTPLENIHQKLEDLS
ncbi:phosphate transport system regulatory protein PhoU [Alteromonas sp. KS69]|jgi:phosphate transport system protein|uniref:Phosphate-specific transport system accessory protein PhoU n=2 Tax=Alteromonas TaxID=226 RepID=A0AAW7YVD8_9ALTE|nr:MULTISPECIES: phosphate signaling complex protein PhoU [Alteromonas]AMJ89742.1 transcriptional regulator PhoU [Alteromonas sp. Mac2]MBB66267.1 phosphate transport system regulatory protein PhoU [Rickettsiales bacterium]AEF04384.1 phosphate transport system regulatory protein PhoU [Alteromonas naphthalenivorans]ALM91691.1 Phosphate transport system regulatory protein PhoU [Alteromonas stellipolaris LMG 21856]AMJ73440.1 transcriptional regulator PhoU [Alteromonas stellipolaris]|tara:strand:- start:7189 stop:7905 length:717 start_codon:yes stop_codon:yes gene_type:complete